MELLVIALLIFLNGLFSMSEIALISSRKARLETDAAQGGKLAAAALELANKPDRFLSVVQIGITLIGILTGLYSGDIFARDIGSWLSAAGMPLAYAVPVAKALIVITVTYFTIIFGELIPKRIAMQAPEKIAKITALPMRFVASVSAPLVWILSKSTAFVFTLLRINEIPQNKVTEEEIKTLVKEGAQDGAIEKVEQHIVERAFSLGDRTVSSIMTHRSDLVWLDISKPMQEIRTTIKNAMHDVYPVADGSLAKLLGVVTLKDLFEKVDQPGFSWDKVIQKPHFVHECTNVYEALEYMQKNRLQYGLISDEFGDLQGIFNLKDILEALVGAMPEHGEEADIIQRSDGSWLIAGQCPFYDFLANFGMEALFQEYNYVTLSGLIIEELGHIPHSGETMQWQSLLMEIVDMDRLRIDKVIVKKIEPPQPEEETDSGE